MGGNSPSSSSVLTISLFFWIEVHLFGIQVQPLPKANQYQPRSEQTIALSQIKRSIPLRSFYPSRVGSQNTEKIWGTDIIIQLDQLLERLYLERHKSRSYKASQLAYRANYPQVQIDINGLLHYHSNWRIFLEDKRANHQNWRELALNQKDQLFQLLNIPNIYPLLSVCDPFSDRSQIYHRRHLLKDGQTESPKRSK